MLITNLQFIALITARKIKTRIQRAGLRQAHLILAKKKMQQRQRYDSLKLSFEKHYSLLNQFAFTRFVTPLWSDFNVRVEKALLPYPPFSFLNDPTIMLTMFGGSTYDREIAYLRKKYNNTDLRKLLEEDYIGDPLLINEKYLTSFNSIRQLYILTLYFEKSKVKQKEIKSVFEWGGGYGNMAKLFLRLNKTRLTYIMTDTPVFSCLQWLYLSVVFGKDRVKLILKKGESIPKGKIVIIPVGLLKEYANKISVDFFISTWGLSESAKCAHDFVDKNSWFAARHILLGYQKTSSNLPSAEYAAHLAGKRSAVCEELSILPNNYLAYI